jgi:hypothetical protein
MDDLSRLQTLIKIMQAQSPLGSGIAPYGIRHSGEGVKGGGYFGPVPNPKGGVSTEISSSFDQGGKTIEHPLMVPTLSPQEMQHLLSGAEPTPEIFQKAQAHALQRIGINKSPFAGPQEIRYPVPR